MKAFLLLVFVLCASGCQIPWYASNASGIVERIANSKTSDQLLAELPQEAPHRKALEDLPEVLEFARHKGLNVGGAYQRIDVMPDPVSFIVIAAQPESLTLHQWDFPIVGLAPYKGYRFLKHAQREAQALQSQGLISCVYPVEAFSSLGWFPEALPGAILSLSEPRRVRIIFHELVHRTIFFPGKADLNESLANYLGDEFAKEWIEKRYGRASVQFVDLHDEIQDQERLRQRVLRLKEQWSAPTLQDDLEQFQEELRSETWMSQMGREQSVRIWTLPMILMLQVYDSGAWPWKEVWEKCQGDVDVLQWLIQREFLGTP